MSKEAEPVYQVLITIDPYIAWQDCSKETYEQITEYKKRILYTKSSPARKPMTEREIMEQAKVDGFDAIDTAVFAIGVRWAERMHGIGD